MRRDVTREVVNALHGLFQFSIYTQTGLYLSDTVRRLRIDTNEMNGIAGSDGYVAATAPVLRTARG